MATIVTIKLASPSGRGHIGFRPGPWNGTRQRGVDDLLDSGWNL